MAESETKQAQMDRRDFTKGAAALGMAAAAASSGPLVRKAKGADKVVKYAMIGPGSRGRRLLERHLVHMEHGECVALCDIYQKNLDRALKVFDDRPAAYTDYNELLQDDSIEAVFITVPLFLHYPVMKAALEAGKHVFCEKSLVFTPEEVHGLKALHEQHPEQIIQVGLQRRYSKLYQRAKDLIDSGAIGEVTHIQAQWHRNTNWRRKASAEFEDQFNWRLYRQYSGGLCAELMSHQVDVADWILDQHPKSVMGVGGLDYWKDGRDIYDNIQLVFEYPGGQKLQYSSIMTNRHIAGRRVPGDGCRETILGTDGAIELTLIPYGDGMLYPDVMKVKMEDQAKQKDDGENWVAGATVGMDTAEQGDGFPIDPEAVDPNQVSFVEKELFFAKTWAYNKGILRPEEDIDPEYAELSSFLKDVATGSRPKADIGVGLQDSVAVMLANLAMDEQRKVQFAEIEQMGRADVELTSAGSPSRGD
ncbi:MAG: Gfo/Idh/MocA family oxidoreductase [Bryobacterales bacterium]|nr:Gfo/Idh/MocA family oxidoreductase [Bryobacterales bacterium]